jgi:type IV secretion system protein VirD4
MGFFDDLAAGLREGRDAAVADHKGRRRPAPAPPNRPRDDAPPARGEPSPIRVGYYYDREKDAVGEPNLYCGERHFVLFGLNGAGKSTRFLIELLMTASGRSLFVFDVKGELAFQTADERRRYGPVKVINPYGLHGMRSDGFNPLAQLDPDSPLLYDAAAAIGEALIEIEAGSGQYWSESAQGLLVALVMWEVILARREGRMPSLVNVRVMLTEPDEYEDYVDGLGQTRKRIVKGMAITAARMVASGNPVITSLAARFTRQEGLNELAGIKSTADTQTQWMLSDPMRADLEKKGVDLQDLRKRPTTVFVVLPADEITTKRRWTRVVVASALAVHFKPGPTKTLFILDEFRASVGQMTIINNMWSLVRGYGVQLMPILQSALQLKALFKDEWENYAAQAGGFATLGPPGDLFTAEWMSKRSGVTTIMQAAFNLSDGMNSGDSTNAGSGMGQGGMSINQGQGFSHGRNSGGGLGFQQTERPAFLPNELMDIPVGHGRMWLAGLGTESIPFFAPNYWKRRAPWVARVKPNPYRAGGTRK